MSEEITSEMISRRATFSLLGAAAALSVAAPATRLTAAEAAFGIRGAFLDFIDDPWRHVGRESEAARFHADGLLVVQDGRIADFGAHDEVAARHVGLVVTTIPDRLVLPGFIDGHVHFPQTRVLGAFGEHLLPWLEKWVFPEEIKFKDRAYAREAADRRPHRHRSPGAAWLCQQPRGLLSRQQAADRALSPARTRPLRHHAAQRARRDARSDGRLRAPETRAPGLL